MGKEQNMKKLFLIGHFKIYLKLVIELRVCKTLLMESSESDFS